jgi:type I restriction enzyme, S subunit
MNEGPGMSTIPKGYKKTAVGVIPEDWDCVNLGQVATPIIGLTYSPNDVFRDGILVLRSSNIQNGNLTFEDNVYVRCQVPDRVIVHEDDILICVRNGSRQLIGKCVLINKTVAGCAFGAFMSILRSPLSRFIFYCFQSECIQQQISEVMGATINQITNRDLNLFFIPLPPLPEQKRIAQVLGDVDALIQKLESLIAKKRDIKQASMQELLTGKRRLPGFSATGRFQQTEAGLIPKEWQVSSIKDIAFVGRGRVISLNEIGRSTSSDYPVFSSQTTNNGIMGYLNSYDFEGEYITWTTDGEKAGKVFQRSGRFNCTNVCGTIKLKKDNYGYITRALDRLTPKYVSHNLANPKLMNDVMKNIIIPIPPLPEQSTIAQVLSDMDSELARLETRLAKTRDMKAGLMQELLTGRIRL